MQNYEGLVNKLSLLGLVSQIPISLVDSEGTTEYCTSVEEHHLWSDVSSRLVLENYKNSNLPDGIPYMHVFRLDYMLGVVPLPDNEFILVGPTNIKKVSYEETLIAFRPILPEAEIARLYALFERSVPTDLMRFAGVLALISNAMNATKFSPSVIIKNNYLTLTDIEQSHPDPFISSNMIIIEPIIMLQEAISSDIESGNMDALSKQWSHPAFNSLRMSDIARENLAYFFIPFFTYMFRGAIRGGADPNLCFEKYSIQVERFKQAGNSAACFAQLEKAAEEYCSLVIECSEKTIMPEICSKCISYINDHIHEKITTDMLAHYCGVYKNKLYEVFRSHFGMTIVEYIETERLRRAIIYLKNSNYTISEIASAMGYPSQSYFTKIFKKHFGCTPGNYK